MRGNSTHSTKLFPAAAHQLKQTVTHGKRGTFIIHHHHLPDKVMESVESCLPPVFNTSSSQLVVSLNVYCFPEVIAGQSKRTGSSFAPKLKTISKLHHVRNVQQYNLF